MSNSATHSRSTSRHDGINPTLAEATIAASAAATVPAASSSDPSPSQSDASPAEPSATSPSPSTSSATSLPSPRPRSVGSVVVGLVGRIGGRPDTSAEGTGIDEGEDEDEDDDAEPAPKNSPTFNLPAHAASRTHCPTCNEQFDLGLHLPILLHAGHNFCAQCMTSSNALTSVGSSVTCAVCRLVVEIPDDNGSKMASLAFKIAMQRSGPLPQEKDVGGAAAAAIASLPLSAASAPLAAFPINYILADQLELSAFKEKVERAEIPCVKCDDPATGTCTQCETWLCEFHQQDHRKSKETRSHPLKSMEEFLNPAAANVDGEDDESASTQGPASISSHTFCSLHPDTELDLFCMDCKIPVCIRCTLPSGGSIHCTTSGTTSGGDSTILKQHTFESLKLQTQRTFHELHSRNEASKTRYAQLIKGMIQIQKLAGKIEERAEKVQTQINSTFEFLHQQLEKRRDELSQKLSSLVSTKNYTLNVQNQILYILARAVEDSTLEVDEMLDRVRETSVNNILPPPVQKDPRTNHGPGFPIAPGSARKSSPVRGGGTGGATRAGKEKQESKEQTPSSSSTTTTTTTKSLSSASKLLHISSHLSSNLEALLKFQPVSIQPEESDQFGFIAGVGGVGGSLTTTSTGTGGHTGSGTSVPNSVHSTPRSGGSLQRRTGKSTSVDNKNSQQQQPQTDEDDIGVDEKLLSLISKTGTLGDSMAIASLCTASGDGLHSTFVRLESRFQIQSRDRFGQLKRRGGDPFIVEFIGPKGSASGRVTDHQNGTYTVRYMVLQPGQYQVVVSIHGRHIQGSPFRVLVHGAKDGVLAIGRELLTTIGSRGSGGNGQMLNPMGLCAGGVGGSEGILYLADFGNNRILMFRLSNGGSSPAYMKALGGGAGGANKQQQAGGSIAGGVEHGSFQHPWACAVDPLTGQLFVTDSANHRVQVFTAQGEWLRSWGTVGGGQGKFRHPAGIVIYTPLGAQASLTVGGGNSTGSSSTGANDPNATASSSSSTSTPTQSHSTLSGNDANSGPSSTAAAPSLGDTPIRPSSPGVASAGSNTSSSAVNTSTAGQLVFVADREKHRVQVFDLQGKFLRLFGSSGSGPGQFLHPSGLALDPRSQQLFVADFSNHRISVWNLQGQFLHQWGVRGTLPGQFVDPVGISVDREGLVYVADQGNHRIQVFSPDGTFLRLLGQGKQDGTGNTKNPFSKPSALAIISLRSEGSVVHLHESNGDDSNASQGGTNSSSDASPGVITNTLVYVSDAANHRLQIFQ